MIFQYCIIECSNWNFIVSNIEITKSGVYLFFFLFSSRFLFENLWWKKKSNKISIFIEVEIERGVKSTLRSAQLHLILLLLSFVNHIIDSVNEKKCMRKMPNITGNDCSQEMYTKKKTPTVQNSNGKKMFGRAKRLKKNSEIRQV